MKTKPEPINPFDQILTVADQAARELDSEPVSEEWLRSVGFEKFGMSSLRIEAPSQLPEGVARFYLNCTKYMNILGPWELWNCFDDTAQPVGVCLPCVPKTRGDVIRLCSVLGIELK
jgi:hypothetical protein